MHDTAIVQSLCNQVEQLAHKHGAHKVVRITLEVGEEFELSPDHMKETFLTFRGASPLLRETEIDFRKSPRLHDHEMILRDTELEI
jgi:Zn finger protein HypA/HybF involved in hydrogenase expression